MENPLARTHERSTRNRIVAGAAVAVAGLGIAWKVMMHQHNKALERLEAEDPIFPADEQAPVADAVEPSATAPTGDNVVELSQRQANPPQTES